MKTFLSLAATLSALALNGCAAVPNGPIVDSGSAVRKDGLAMIGQPTRVGSLIVTPEALVEDSRCPMNARCVWAGRLVVSTRIDGGGWRETTNLTLGQPYAAHGTSITLTSGTPEKMAGTQVPPQPMTFGFEGGR